ncbi:hypothetical protein ACI3L1_19520 [Deinococcus sp. SM5_A1]|uniref:hypothetical protein n=1 Tax=Deinococcus sp. SM5_A1 TaxID=3379094 RepID=UPI00385B5395
MDDPLGSLCDAPEDSRRRGLCGYGIPAFDYTPDHFPGLIAATMRGDDAAVWATAQGTVTKGGAAGYGGGGQSREASQP